MIIHFERFSSRFFFLFFESRDLDLERINFLFSSACTLFSFLRRGGRFGRKEGKSKWMSGSKWKLEGEGSSGRHLTGKRHSHRIQPRSFLSLPPVCFASFANLLPPPPPPSMKGCLFRPFLLVTAQTDGIPRLSCMNELTHRKIVVFVNFFLQVFSLYLSDNIPRKSLTSETF